MHIPPNPDVIRGGWSNFKEVGPSRKISKWALQQIALREEALQEVRGYFNPYDNVQQLFADLGIQQPSKMDWRLVKKAAVGSIHGVPNSDGLLYATDGILCLLLRTSRSHFIGHLENFEYMVASDDPEVLALIEQLAEERGLNVKAEKKAKKPKLIDILLKDL